MARLVGHRLAEQANVLGRKHQIGPRVREDADGDPARFRGHQRAGDAARDAVQATQRAVDVLDDDDVHVAERGLLADRDIFRGVSERPDGLRQFWYDESNRISKATVSDADEGSKVSYLHNTLDQRVFKSEPQVAQTAPD